MFQARSLHNKWQTERFQLLVDQMYKWHLQFDKSIGYQQQLV